MTIDYTRMLDKLIPVADGQDVLRLRTGLVMAINSDGTLDVAISGVTVEDIPVLGDNSGFIVSQPCQVLTYRGSLLVLGQVGSGTAGPVTRPSAFMTFGTPTITNNSVTTLTPSTVPVNDAAMYPGSGTTFTIPTGQSGLYEIGMVLRYALQATAIGVRYAAFFVNGVENITWQMPTTTSFNGARITVGGVTRVSLTAGNTVTFSAYQNSGVSLALDGNSVAWIERER